MQALWMVLAAFIFASMGVCVKMASAHFNAAELVFYRGLIGIAILWMLARSQQITLATRYPGMHAWRSLVGVVSLGAWFYAIGKLPLATAMTLNYMSSVWIAAFLVGGALMAWRPTAATPRPAFQGSLVLTVLTGFVGVVLMLRPSLDQNQAFAGLVGLLSGMTAAFAYMQVVALSRLGEPESRTVFYFAVGSAVAGGRGHGLHWHVGLAGLARPVVAAHWRSGGSRAAVHDARVLHSQNLARHAGGGQFAVFGHCVRCHLQRGVV